MKIEAKTTYTANFTEEELAKFKKYIAAIKTIKNNSICTCVDCLGISCVNCPLQKISDVEDQLNGALIQFIQTYQKTQKLFPDLPSID